MRLIERKDYIDKLISLKNTPDIKVITGSNAFLLSSDLATLFTGRVHEIEILPFSFKEYLLYFPQDNYEEAFDNYLLCGGMSGGYLYPTVEETYKYIADVFDTVILRDIRQKYKIKNVVLMDRIADFLMDNISNLSSARRIAETLNSNEDKINHKTVHLYMDYLCKSFVFHKVRRYDIMSVSEREQAEPIHRERRMAIMN
ncbi:MAG: AAA family ATPase, partial [Clostridiaceae bacterium]|nr:AAA family ATPase [Clostridiaceae bacterium]